MRRILLIDDDRDDAELFRDALEEVDKEADFAHYDGDEAVAALMQRTIPLPDLIFLDINMPSISGWKCLRFFKGDEHLRDIPVIMYTTSSQVREKEMARELGASGYITKPNDFKLLKHMLAAIAAMPSSELGGLFEKNIQ